MSKETLLLEIGMEECPARFVGPALEELERALRKALEAGRLGCESVETYGTPRRLAAVVRGVSLRQSDLEQEVKGPAARVAFDEAGNPTRAALGFAASQGVSVDALVVRETEAGAYVFARKVEPGRPAHEVLPSLLEGAVAGLSFPKSMRWGDGTVRFARPVRWIVCLLGSEVVPFTFGDVTAGRATRGHRFLAPGEIALARAEEYVERLEREGRVVADVARRRETIRRQVEQAAASIEGAALVDDALLDEVTNLVEWPTALVGRFDAKYLAVPREILVTTMKEHQRYFPVVGPAGELLNAFVAVSNGDEASVDQVRRGNEKVLSARLADAKFFYDEDKKRPLSERVEELGSILFQERLGTLRQKVERVRSIVRKVGEVYPAEVVAVADRAALLCKADLVTHVVYEFPELQGVMGEKYALASGEGEAVARAIFEHYLPRYAGDELPATPSGVLVSLADKIDTVTGCFGIGLVPTGSQDPYALRRQALGILRILLAHRPAITLGRLVRVAIEEHGPVISDSEGTCDAVLAFFAGRMRTMLAEKGVRHDLVEAGLAPGVEDAIAAWERTEALARAAGTESFDGLRTAYQRAANLAKKGRQGATVDPSLFKHEAEQRLWEQVNEVGSQVAAFVEQKRFDDALRALANLRAPVDAFFESVLVMDPEEAVRENRLALLEAVVRAFSGVGDLSRIGEG